MKKGKKCLALVPALSMLAGMFAACKGASSTSSDGRITLDNVRDYVVGLDEEMDLESGGKKSVTNFDNAATTPCASAGYGCS